MDFDPREFLVDHFMNERVEDQLYDITFGSEEWLQMDAGLLTREEGDRIMREKGAALRRSFEVGVILDDWYDMLRTKDDTVQLIKRLKKRGYGVFYLSNISWDVLEMLQQRKFWQLFDGGVASCEVKLTKPDLRIYHALLAKYGLSAAESIFIDDNTANASAAFDADITGIHFKNVRTLQRALQRTHIFEVDPSDIRVESGGRIGGVVVNENGFRCRKTVFGQKRMVDAQVGLGQLYLTGSNSAVEQLPEFALLQHFQHVPGNIRKVKHAVSALFQPLDELHGVVLGAQHIVPVVQNNAHLKGTAQSRALFAHDAVAFLAGEQAGVHLQPFLTAEGNVVELVLHTFVHEMVDEEFARVKIHHDAAQIKNNIFIQNVHLSCAGERVPLDSARLVRGARRRARGRPGPKKRLSAAFSLLYNIFCGIERASFGIGMECRRVAGEGRLSL